MSKAKNYYGDDFLAKQLAYYRSLPEKQKRHFLGLEFARLGTGSKRYLARVFGCARQTIRIRTAGIGGAELSGGLCPPTHRWRGTQKKEVAFAQLTTWILALVEQHTAGSPTDETRTWTHLRPCDIALHLRQTYHITVSHGCIKRVLQGQGYRQRKPAKNLATGKSPDRSEQFRIIAVLWGLFMQTEENPIISIDTKKKEILGALTRNQAVLTKGAQGIPTFDHDYPYLGNGKAIPHGIYDMKLNEGYLSLGHSHETAEFVVDNIEWWWENVGNYEYPHATRILILCDSGGANGYRHITERHRICYVKFKRLIS